MDETIVVFVDIVGGFVVAFESICVFVVVNVSVVVVFVFDKVVFVAAAIVVAVVAAVVCVDVFKL